ncbi:DUF1015 domain-containing protein [Guggenheimella bovis]
MAIVRPFKAIRPNKQDASKVASLPYDVMNREEAKEMAKGNPKSYLHIVRSEIDLPDSVGDYEPEVYQKAKENLHAFVQNGTMAQDKEPLFYIYRMIMKGRVQTGLVATTSIDEYLSNDIKKHEFTREEKEQDRIRHFDVTDANTEPIFLAYRHNDKIETLMNDFIKFHDPDYDFTTEDGITHIFWAITDRETNEQIEQEFKQIPALYIADGHHRSASSAKVGMKRREENPNYKGDEEFNFFMSVLFSDKDLFIMDYNRVLKDLNGLSEAEFMERVKEKFIVTDAPEAPFKPSKKHHFGMFMDGKWYELEAKKEIIKNDPIGSLDVSILQENLLNPILGIGDPRTDKRIDFVGGIRGLNELERRATTDMKVAFSMYPTTMEDLLSIADNNLIMPPKSTWFEPKLRSGLFVHLLHD